MNELKAITLEVVKGDFVENAKAFYLQDLTFNALVPGTSENDFFKQADEKTSELPQTLSLTDTKGYKVIDEHRKVLKATRLKIANRNNAVKAHINQTKKEVEEYAEYLTLQFVSRERALQAITDVVDAEKDRIEAERKDVQRIEREKAAKLEAEKQERMQAKSKWLGQNKFAFDGENWHSPFRPQRIVPADILGDIFPWVWDETVSEFEADKAAHEKAEAEKKEAERHKAERLAAFEAKEREEKEKAEADRKAKEKQEKEEKEKQEALRLLAEMDANKETEKQRIADNKAEAERIANEQAELPFAQIAPIVTPQ